MLASMVYKLVEDSYREQNEVHGVWAGGFTSHLAQWCQDRGLKCEYYDHDELPREGAMAWIKADDADVMVHQEYHGGPNSGDWWWLIGTGWLQEDTMDTGKLWIVIETRVNPNDPDFKWLEYVVFSDEDAALEHATNAINTDGVVHCDVSDAQDLT